MFKIVPWSEDLDLEYFYKKAAEKGFTNNSNQKMLVDCFRNEKEWNVWILYFNDKPVGSVASHTLDIMGPKAYRICSRICTFTEDIPRDYKTWTTKSIRTHQNISAQFLIPACIEWAGRDKDLYITTNELPEASQRLVHKIYCPMLEEMGTLNRTGEIFYRGSHQTTWKLNVDVFYKQLEEFGKWQD